MPKLPSLTPQKLSRYSKIRVVVPFHKRDLPRGTLLEILKQAGISKVELRDLL